MQFLHVLLVSAVAFLQTSPFAGRIGPQDHVLVRSVIDGDTIVVSNLGRVRLLANCIAPAAGGSGYTLTTSQLDLNGLTLQESYRATVPAGGFPAVAGPALAADLDGDGQDEQIVILDAFGYGPHCGTDPCQAEFVAALDRQKLLWEFRV